MATLPKDTHYATWDAPGRHEVKALCGTYIRRTEHKDAPSCPECQRLLAHREAQEVQ